PAGVRGTCRGGPGRAGGGGRAAGGAVATVMRNALGRLCAARGWSDVDLAVRAGLDRAHVNQVKNGRATPTVATALALARALEVPVATAFPPGSAAARGGRWRG